MTRDQGGAAGRPVDRSHEDEYPPDWEERRRQVLQRDDFTCQLCGRRGGPYAEDAAVHLHAHHTVPLSEGGSNAVDNLITLCDTCYEHHRGRRDPHAPAEDDGSLLSVGVLAATWAVLLGTTLAALQVFTAVAGEPIVGVEPLVALVAGVALFAVALRLCAAPEWGPLFGTAGAVLTWLLTLRTGGDLWILTDVLETPVAFGAAVALSVAPYVLARYVVFPPGADDTDEDASNSAYGA